MLPTPIMKWKNVPGVPEDIELYVKRDDLTGCGLSGNKIRKLEFILGKAVAEGYDAVITCGRGPQTNHGRATAIAAKELGLECHLVFRGRNFGIDDIKGNMILNCFVGSKFYFLPDTSNNFEYETVVKAKQEQIAEELAATGKRALTIAVGGSDINGLYG